MDEARLTEQGKLVALLRKLATQGGWHHREERDTWGSAADEIEKLAAIIVCERIDAQALREQLGEAQADLEIIRRSQPAAPARLQRVTRVCSWCQQTLGVRWWPRAAGEPAEGVTDTICDACYEKIDPDDEMEE